MSNYPISVEFTDQDFRPKEPPFPEKKDMNIHMNWHTTGFYYRVNLGTIV